MPMYEYQCQSCGQIFELIQKFSDEPLTVHEACGGALEKLVSAPALQFKGSGWYVNDYARKGSNGGGDKGGDSAKSEGKSESGAKSESKGEGKSESKSEGKSESKKDSGSSSSTTPASSATKSDK